MPPTTFRQAGIGDLESLVDYRISFALELTGPKSTEAIADLKQHFRSYFEKSLANQSCIAFLAFQDTTLAGLGIMVLREQPGSFKNPSGKFGYLMNMYTLPEFRRQGICSTILDLLISEAQKLGVTAFELHATKTGEPLYKKAGFEPHIEPTYRKYLP